MPDGVGLVRVRDRSMWIPFKLAYPHFIEAATEVYERILKHVDSVQWRAGVLAWLDGKSFSEARPYFSKVAVSSWTAKWYLSDMDVLHKYLGMGVRVSDMELPIMVAQALKEMEAA